MIRALEIEIGAIKRRGASNQIEIRGGEFRGRVESQYLYTFRVGDESAYLRDESPIRMIAGKDEVDGTVVSLNEGVLVISLERDIGNRVPLARLVADDSFLLERLAKKLEDVRLGTVPFSHERAEQTLGFRAAVSGHGELEQALKVGEPILNPEKFSAIAKALSSQVTYVWGPPGTGKTTALARVVEGFFRTKRTCLLVSNTNAAVDVALAMVGDRLKTEPAFQRGAVIRYGPITNEELQEKYGDQVDVERVVARLSADLHVERQRLEHERSGIERLATPMRQAIEDHEAYTSVQSGLEQLSGGQRLAKRRLEAASAEADSLRQRGDSLRSDLDRALRMGTMRRMLSRLNPDRLSRQIGQAEANRRAREEAAASLQQEVEALSLRIRAQEGRLEPLSQRVSRLPSQEDCRTQVGAYEKQLGQLAEQITQIEAQLDAVRDEVLGASRVLATTAYRTYLKGQVEREFDAVVIDEASMLALPLVFYVAGLAKQTVVVAGDFRQLPPIAQADDNEEVRYWLKSDVFHMAGIVEALRSREDPTALASLQTQYRMDDRICSLANTIFYEERPLITAEAVRGRSPRPFPLGASPLLYVDTTSHHPWTGLRLGTYSRYNLLHALLLRNIAVHLTEEGYVNRGSSDANEALGIVSPFREQIRLVQRLIDERLPNSGGGLARTVHRFQGNERDAIVVDLTDSIGTRPSGLIQSSDIDQEGARLLNVALTRARQHVVLVANFGYLRGHRACGRIVRDVLDFFEEQGQPLDVADLLQLGPEEWLDATRSLEPPTLDFDPETAGAFTESTFYPAFVRDLKDAASSVVIFSPFLTERGTSRWTDIIRAAVSSGVKVRLVTRPPGDQGGMLEKGLEGLLEGLMALEVVVDLRARMHEKFAIIDDLILWHGSLNIFSHRDSSESMLRIPSGAACSQMAQFVTSPARRAPGEKEEQVDLAARENPECPDCGRLMVWKSGRYGVYFECGGGCGAKVDPRRRGGRGRRTDARRQSGSRRRGSSGESATAGVCPECGSAMRQRTGRYGPFLGCTGYPRCRHTESVQ